MPSMRSRSSGPQVRPSPGPSERRSHDNTPKLKPLGPPSIVAIMAVLTEPDNAAKHFKPSQFVLTELTRVVSDKWLKVKDSVRTKVFWMVKELIRN